MSAHVERLCGTVALIAAFVACRDSSTELEGRPAARTPTFATAGDASGGSGSQYHFNAQGDFAIANWSANGESGFTLGSVRVNRGGPAGDPQTSLYYLIEQCDATFNCNVTVGFGQIPNEDFSVTAKSGQLNTNTAGNPNFATYGTIPPGQVTVSWQENGLLQQRSEGTFEESANSGAFRYHSTGLSTSGSADGSGTVVGVSFASTFYAQIGSTSNLTIVISH